MGYDRQTHRFDVIAEWLAGRFPAPERRTMTVLDLACSVGISTTTMARLGWRDVLGIDVRPQHIRACRLRQRRERVPGLRYTVANVWDIERLGGPWDVVNCCGLFYHLAKPLAFLDLLSRVTRRALVLDTHYALRTAPTFPAAEKIGPLAINEELTGRWYREYFTEADKAKNRARRGRAGWDALASFWIERAPLEDLLRARWTVTELPGIHVPEHWRAVYACLKG